VRPVPAPIPEPEVILPEITHRRARLRDVARVGILTAAMAVLLLVAKNGPAGSALLHVFGWSAYLLPLVGAGIGLELLRDGRRWRSWPRMEEINGALSLYLAGLVVCGGWGHGGVLGDALAADLGNYFGQAGVPAAGLCLLALGLVLAVHLNGRHLWIGAKYAGRGALRASRVTGRLLGGTGRGLTRLRGPRRMPRLMRLPAPQDGAPTPFEAAVELDPDLPIPMKGSGRRKRGRTPDPETELPLEAESDPPEAEPDAVVVGGDWALPAIDLLEAVPAPKEATPMDTHLRMRVIEDTLAAFNVKARVTGFHSGPTVTQFDVQPERGVRVQRVTALQNDLALALAARSIRMQAPVPGQSVIGIEIPNAKASVVTLREVLESEQCEAIKSPLKIALGKDVSGTPVLADLARMPHLLIAGSTGSGKSVCLNSLISCLLFHNSPERLRLLMVDPKMVELTVFNDVPHLLAPVVTDVTKVTGTLKWALKEMHRRYKKFAEVKARNLARFNEMQTDPKNRMPFIVIIIDELADLMMVSPEDVEDGICRLAQLARATGMHLVIATQRPSVDVITGLIKANFPARIAFAVSSGVDSRTILDQGGAEKLLGRGDMLYQPSDEGKPIRAQMAYLSDKEIESIVAFWKQTPRGDLERIPEADLEPPAKDEESDSDDKLLKEAVKVLREYNRASVSLLQRRLSIGYTRAARLLDTLEDRGVVGPSEDGRSRIVLATNDVDLSADSDGDGGDDDLPL
jgi:S-DNA-T family DNA segregation ATPase FtsK/SpoIIIE